MSVSTVYRLTAHPPVRTNGVMTARRELSDLDVGRQFGRNVITVPPSSRRNQKIDAATERGHDRIGHVLHGPEGQLALTDRTDIGRSAPAADECESTQRGRGRYRRRIA